jgi:hypothetical protein
MAVRSPETAKLHSSTSQNTMTLTLTATGDLNVRISLILSCIYQLTNVPVERYRETAPFPVSTQINQSEATKHNSSEDLLLLNVLNGMR